MWFQTAIVVIFSAKDQMPFNDDQVYCILDYETYSEAPLKKCGGFEYAVDPSTEILCVAWKVGTRDQLRSAKTYSWTPSKSDNGGTFINRLKDANVIFVAHNAMFEQLITKYVLPRYTINLPDFPPERWLCTASLAAALALPRNLEGACSALSLSVQKDMEGNRLIQKWCKPRKPTKNNPKTRHDDPAEFERIVQYCKTDVDAETELFLTCPPLSDMERRIWILDQEINLRGFLIDRPLVSKTLKMIGEEVKHLNVQTTMITGGSISSATKRNAVLYHVKALGVDLPDLRAKTVRDFLANCENAPDEAHKLLELRQAVSKTSTAKYQNFDLRSKHDSRIRDSLLYWGASTGRWAGRGVQPQNFPKGSIKDTPLACEVLKTGDLDYVRLLYGSPMDVFSSCLRGMIVAPKGKVLDVADYAGIEARVLFWVARHEHGVKAFVDGRDLYRELAVRIFSTKLERVTDKQRFVGKQALLGCGYSMGWKKFMKTCENLGQIVSEDTAQLAVNAYRTAHAPVVSLWSKIQQAAIAAIQNPRTKYTVNRTKWWVENKFLWCELPSGRRLAYYKPSIHHEKTNWGDIRPQIYHWGVNSLSKKWENQKTYGGKLVENVVQAISRDVMAEAMIRIDSAGPWEIILSVHDELLAERDPRFCGVKPTSSTHGFVDKIFSEKDFIKLMTTLPTWADGCPIKVEGWSGERYRK